VKEKFRHGGIFQGTGADFQLSAASISPAKSRICPLAQNQKSFWFFSSEKNTLNPYPFDLSNLSLAC
jgi:hypothetical protein